MWEFIDDPHSPIGWAITAAVGLLLIWLLVRWPSKPGPRKEDQWPFGEDPRRHGVSPADLTKRTICWPGPQ